MAAEGCATPVIGQSASAIRVAVIDDSTVMRWGLRSLLLAERGIEIVAEVGADQDVLSHLRPSNADVVLLELKMPWRERISLVGQLSELGRVVVLSFSEDAEAVRTAMSEGASGYLVHGSFDAGSLAAMVRGVAGGATALSSPALAAVLASGQVAGGVRNLWNLSPRQVEVMGLVARGHRNARIAAELFLSEKTVKNHINQIFGKLAVTSRGEAIARWLGTTEG